MGTARMFGPRRINKNLWQRLKDLNWGIILIISLLAGVGVAILYSVSGGEWEPWASRHAIRYAVAFFLMISIAVIDIRVWMTLAYPLWALGLALLILVELIGAVGMGGQRWLDLGFIRIQPSELMKLAIVLALARYYHARTYLQARQLRSLFIPCVLIFLPAALVVIQPDFGTGLMMVMGGVAVLLLAGVPIWLFIAGGTAILASVPIVWSLMKDYQKSRVLTFLNPESDPLGAGYQITQSKIALGSGGLMGKGFLEGTQSHLNFLPEMKTDFIFTVLVEEFGLVGAVTVLSLFLLVLLYGLLIGIGCRSQFGRLLSGGLSITLFLYVLINVGMIMGLMPVVGVPLPLISYGGSAMLTWAIGFGLILSVSIHRHVTLAPRGSGLR